ncbi:MAG TPA: acyltransferase [Puia sp.]|jgi:galactoside O-acetyltransferase
MMPGYFSEDELLQLGFARLGRDVRISRTSTIYNCGKIEIGDHVRIDNFCTVALSGTARLTIGNYVHLSAYNFINGAAGLTIGNFVTTAPYVGIFTSTDDYSGEHLHGAVVPGELIGTFSAAVDIHNHCIIGTGSTLMPGVTLEEGVAVAAHSFVKNNFGRLSIAGGVPAKVIGKRAEGFLQLEKRIHG